MVRKRLNDLEIGEHYTAQELESFVSTTEVILLSSNEGQLFNDPDKEYKVIDYFAGFFEHSPDTGEKYFREKKAYVVKKV